MRKEGKEIIILEEPKIPSKWNYKESVKKVKVLVYKWKNLTEEVVIEISIARTILRNPGARTDLKKTETWESYCKEIGVDRSTVHRWIDRYFVANATRSEVPKLEVPKEVKIDIKNGDFRELIKNLPDNSIDLVLTDPPYSKEYLPLWSDLARESVRVLKPSRFLISYSGQAYLPEVMNSLSGYLEYYWLMGLYHKGNTGQIFNVNMWNRFKPILIYYKPPREKQKEWLEDMVISEAPDKDKHKWGQSVGSFVQLIEYFSKPGDTILDPMFGGGAVIEAAMKTKRNIIGYEIEKETYNLVKIRIELNEPRRKIKLER